MKSWWLGLGVILAIVAIVVLLNLGQDPDRFRIDWELAPKPPSEVTLAEPSSQTIIKVISAPGEVEARDEAEIASQVVGRVIEVPFQEGDSVQKGDVLVRLDDEDLQQIVASSQARLERIESMIEASSEELTKAERDLTRNQRLLQQNAIKETSVLDGETLVKTTRANLAMSRAELAEAKANLARTQKELSYTIIRSPMNGVIADLEVEEGEVVIAGTTNLPGTVLMTINDLDQLQVRARIAQSDIRLVEPSQQSTIYLQGDAISELKGTVEQIAPKGSKDGDVVSFETLIRIDNPSKAVRVGMTATVEVEVDQTEAEICIPVSAVVHRKLKELPQTNEFKTWAQNQPLAPGETEVMAAARYIKVVFVADQGKARAVPVRTGLSDERYVEILEGLLPEQQVITGPFRVLDEIRDGQPILLAAEPNNSETGTPKADDDQVTTSSQETLQP